MLAHYKHARLSGVKLVGGPSNAVRFEHDATADELREQIMRRIAALRHAGVIDLEALPTPKGGILCQSMPRSVTCLFQTVSASISAKADV
jgi:hypothetical protein